jgi:hypothetical protein
VAEALDCRLHINAAVRPQPHCAPAVEMTIEDFAAKGCAGSFEQHPGARLQLLSRVHERFPHLRRFSWMLGSWRCAPRDKKTLDLSTAGVAPADQTGRKHASVIENEEIAVAKVLSEIAKSRVRDPSVRPSKHEQT